MRRILMVGIMTNSGNHPPAERLQDAGQADSPVTTAKARILIIEDETSVALMMVFLLTRAGCEADTSLNAEKALRLLQTGTYDLISLDVNLPGTGGFELFKQLKQMPHLKAIPVVFVSGNSTIENQQRALDLGAVDFIEKPFDARDFVSRILALVTPRASTAYMGSATPIES